MNALLPRGFASWAESTSTELRAEIGLDAHDPIDPFSLSDHLEIPVLHLSDAPQLDERHRTVLLESGEFSAVTVFCGRRSMIVVNNGHSVERVNSSVCHEISHAACLHPPDELFMAGCRQFRSQKEAEADRLAGALLIPGAGARRAARQGWSEERVAHHYGTSIQMARWRINVSGARRGAA